MRKMNEEDKQKIMQQVELFRREKLTFDSEVAKWDDTGNDIIYLAKHMCMIMMEMTDFTRYDTKPMHTNTHLTLLTSSAIDLVSSILNDFLSCAADVAH